ncbi:sulfatase [Halolamina sp. C58]|uniref:sulfatase n=1 Tax=Halolamina sp. C58 TaxID=3421640 RepID=UPI003EB8D979
MSETRPNVLCISIDSLRMDFCSVFNSEEATTPNLESLASSGAVFPFAISPSTWTLQVHASIFTGLYPPEHQVFDKDRVLGDVPTLPEKMSDTGYDTKSFGYNGWLEAGDILRGFDHTSSSPPHRGLENKLRKASFTHTPRDKLTIRNCINEIKDSTRPFCHFIHLNNTHYPYIPTNPKHKEFTNIATPRLTYNLLKQRQLYNNRAKIYTGDFWPDESTVNTAKNLYRGTIKQADEMVNHLLETLSEESLLKETIIIIFGDHGDSFGEDGIFGHQYSVSDSIIRVPLIIRDPTNVLAQGNHSDIVQLNDLFPTILDLCGIEPPETNSHSLTNKNSRETAFTYYSVPESFVERISSDVDIDELPPKRQYAAWQSPEKKIIHYPDEDTWSGPASKNETFRSKLIKHQSNLNPVDVSNDDELNENVLQNLKDMGYI